MMQTRHPSSSPYVYIEGSVKKCIFSVLHRQEFISNVILHRCVGLGLAITHRWCNFSPNALCIYVLTHVWILIQRKKRTRYCFSLWIKCYNVTFNVFPFLLLRVIPNSICLFASYFFHVILNECHPTLLNRNDIIQIQKKIGKTSADEMKCVYLVLFGHNQGSDCLKKKIHLLIVHCRCFWNN